MTDTLTAPARTLARWETPKLNPTCPADAHWSGWLTMGNLDDVTARITALLTGVRYTAVAVNEYFSYRPEVRTGNRLVDAPRTYRGDGYAGITWADGRYVTGLHTSVQTQAAARALAETDGGVRQLTVVTFEPAFRDAGTLLVEHYTPAGSKLYWTFSVEHPDVDA